MKPVEDLTNAELIGEFVRLAKAARMTQSGAADAVGVTQPTASEWWRKVYRDLRPENRRALEDFVKGARTGHASGKSPSNGLPSSPGGMPEEAYDGFFQRVDEINRADMAEGMKIMKIDALASAIRAEQGRRAEMAAEARARAVERAEAAAESRARAIEREMDAGRASMRAVAGGSPIATETRVGDLIPDDEVATQVGPAPRPGQASPSAEQ
jgi:hypothetical protein